MKKISIYILLLFTAACEEKLPNLKLPDKTQEGLNTLGFLIDGIPWTNYGRGCTYAGCDDNKVVAMFEKYAIDTVIHFQLSISAGYTIMSREIDQSFDIYIKDISSVGTYPLDFNSDAKMIFTSSRYTQTFKEFTNFGSSNAVLQITKLDTVSNIISGEFSGHLINPRNTSEEVKIEQGRFDAKLDYRK